MRQFVDGMLAGMGIDRVRFPGVFDCGRAAQLEQASRSLEPGTSIAVAVDVGCSFHRGLDDQVVGSAQIRSPGRMHVQNRYHGYRCRNLELNVISETYKHGLLGLLPERESWLDY